MGAVAPRNWSAETLDSIFLTDSINMLPSAGPHEPARLLREPVAGRWMVDCPNVFPSASLNVCWFPS